MKILISFVMALLLAAPAVFGQESETTPPAKSWGAKGVTISVTPRWQTPSWYKALYGAREVDLSGQAFNVGLVIRASDGHPGEGHLALSFVNNLIEGQVIRREAPGSTGRLIDRYLSQGVQLRGVQFEGMSPFTHGRGARLTLQWNAGVGFLQGNVLNVFDLYFLGDHDHGEIQTSAKELITFHESPLPVVPIFGLELGVIAPLGNGVSVGGSFGPHFPTGLGGSVSLTWVP